MGINTEVEDERLKGSEGWLMMSYRVKTFVTNSGLWAAGPTAEESLERFLNDNSENIHYIVQIFAKNEGIVLVYKKKDK